MLKQGLGWGEEPMAMTLQARVDTEHDLSYMLSFQACWQCNVVTSHKS